MTMLQKHAYCIIAHNEPGLLQTLTGLLDHPLNDIYIHIDARSDISAFSGITCQHSRLVFLSERIPVRWGHTSQIECELLLFGAARQGGDYAYYHLLSGVDLPLKPQQYIHQYLDETHPGKILVSVLEGEDDMKDVAYKTRFHHLFTDRLGIRRYRMVRNFVIRLEKLSGYRRKYPFPLYKGSNWVSLPQDFLDWLLPQKEQILRMFRQTWCTDEVFIQSLLLASPFRDRMMDNRREIRFEGPVPHVWTQEDRDVLLRSEMFFARKFSSAHPEIIRILAESLQSHA